MQKRREKNNNKGKIYIFTDIYVKEKKNKQTNNNKKLTIRNPYKVTYLFLAQFIPIPIPSKADSKEALRKMTNILRSTCC